MTAGDSFFALKNFAKGKISKYDLMDSDPLISSISENPNNPGQSIIQIRFDDNSEFLKFLGLHEDDVWFAIRVDSSYDSYDYVDSYTAKEDFMSGDGFLWDLNDENRELLNKISKLIGLGNFNFEDENQRKNLSEKLDKLYHKEIENLCGDYAHEKNREMNITANESIRKEITNFVEDYGFELLPYYGIKTTVADLLSLYIQHNLPHVSLKKLLTKIFEEKSGHIGGWSDNMYEYQDDENFDSNEFNRDAESIFEKILDNLEEQEGFEPFIEMIDRVTKKFKTNTWYDLPKDKRYRIKVLGFDRDNHKINVELKGPNYGRKFSISEEGFNKLLYNLELFDLADK